MNEPTLYEQGFYNGIVKGVRHMIAPDATWEEETCTDENVSECQSESQK